MNGFYWLIFVLSTAICGPGDADLSISTSTPTPCYGDVVTLVCHHPEVASNRRKYFSLTPIWTENNFVITIADGTIYTDETVANLTSTILTINITVDHFRNKSFEYSCELVLTDKNGWLTGGVETSGKVTIDPVDLTPPLITTMVPLESSIILRWTPQPCAVRYNISWMYTNDDGTTATGSGVSDQVTNYTIPTSVQGVYTVLVQVVDGVGNIGPAASLRVKSTYPRPSADAPSCKNRSLVLTCLVSGLLEYERFIWMDSRGAVSNSNQYIIDGDQLIIKDVCAISDGDGMSYQCVGVLPIGSIVMGKDYHVEPLAQPGPPVVTIVAIADSTITLTWNTTLHCFESEMFTFVVIWNEIGSGTSTNVTTSSPPYTISGLQPGTSYQISVHGVGGSGITGSKSVSYIVTSTAITSGLSTGLIASIVVVCVVVILLTFLAGCGVGVIVFIVYQKKSKQSTRSTEGTVDEDKKNSPIPSYVNVELDDGSVPMTTNPGYMHVERMTEGSKPLYGNL